MELTNHTYLRSRVDMQLADSLRKKASNKISAGALGNARENAGGFSAGIRFKSNQYLLQSRRANIQNSLSYLEVQRNSIMEARDIMERIALTKIKFDSPTMNQTDRNNLNLEFMELTEELISLREKKFNGVSLFTPTSTASPELFGSSRSNLETGSGSNNGVGISQHVIDYQDVRNIYDAGEAVRRGKAGLSVINFEADPVQRQIERVVIGGAIADGDVFSLKLNELSSIREVESTHTISVTADNDDESAAVLDDGPDGVANSGDEFYVFANSYTRIRDKLIAEINNQAANGKNGQFVTASADANDSPNVILITSEGEGDPFDLFEVTSSGSGGSISKSSDDREANLVDNNITPGLVGNDPGTGLSLLNEAEERTLTLDWKHNTLNTGPVINGDERLSVVLNGQTIFYQPNLDGVNPGGLTAPEDPTLYADAARYMLTGLQEKINNAFTAGTINVKADAPQILTGVGATMVIRSTDRGEPMRVTSQDAALDVTDTRDPGTQIDATPSEVTFSMPTAATGGRDAKAGDQVTVSKADGTSVTFDFDAAAGVGDALKFSSFADLRAKINAHAQFDATITGNDITIKDANPDDTNGQGIVGLGRKQPNSTKITVNQTQLEDSGSVLTINNPTAKLFATGSGALSNTFTALTTAKTTGSGNDALTVGFNVNPTSGAVSTFSVTSAGSGYAKGDQFTVDRALLGDTEAGSITFSVASVTGNVTSLNNGTTALADGDHTVAAAAISATKSDGVTVSDGSGLSFEVNITSGVVSVAPADITNQGTQYVGGDIITIDGGALGGTSGTDDVVLTVGAAGTAVASIAHSSGTAQTTWNLTATDMAKPAGSTRLQLSATAGRDGVITVNTINNNGRDYTNSNISLRMAGSGIVTGDSINKNFTITSVEGKFTNAEDTFITTTNAELGDQFIPAGAEINLSDSISTNNNVGGERNISVTVGVDGGGTDGGQIAPGDKFTITVSEVLHPHESSGSWPESETSPSGTGEGNRAGNPHSFSATVMADAGDDANDIAQKLKNALDTERAAYIAGDPTGTPPVPAKPLADNDLPDISYTAGSNVISLKTNENGEDFDIQLSYSSSVDSISGTGNGNLAFDPQGKIIPPDAGLRQKNISPFSVTKSISYFEEMLAQNEAETSRLMKAMEHLENSMVHNEDALSKVQDTDYSQASVEQMRNAVKMQMANNVIGKSMRMNDLLIDLATKHHRGSILDAKA